MSVHFGTNDILFEKQKICLGESSGCKEQLITVSLNAAQVTRGQGYVFSFYIDDAKSFDNVPHTFLINLLCLYCMNSNLTKFLATVMEDHIIWGYQ